MDLGHRLLYAKHVAGFRRLIPASRKVAAPPGNVSAVVEEALTARRPKGRYVVGLGPKFQTVLMRNLPSAVSDVVLRKAFGQP